MKQSAKCQPFSKDLPIECRFSITKITSLVMLTSSFYCGDHQSLNVHRRVISRASTDVSLCSFWDGWGYPRDVVCGCQVNYLQSSCHFSTTWSLRSAKLTLPKGAAHILPYDLELGRLRVSTRSPHQL